MSLKKIEFPYYQVKSGENLKTISEKFGIESTKILLDNKLSPKQIKEGIFIILKK
jgi:LysM repeat protein